MSQKEIGSRSAGFTDRKAGVRLAVEDQDGATGGGENPCQKASRETASEYHSVAVH
jgi:hypothetical protein